MENSTISLLCWLQPASLPLGGSHDLVFLLLKNKMVANQGTRQITVTEIELLSFLK